MQSEGSVCPLTDAEREAIQFAAVFYEMGGRADDAATLRALLDRTQNIRETHQI
jgi:hypothetical protein